MLTAEPKAYGSNWYAGTRVESPARPRLNVELDVDVCVIGAGLAGLTAAREVARLGWSVVVLEAQSIAWSASGRNTGVVLPGFGLRANALIERVGLDQTKALWLRSVAGAEYVRNAARDMPGTALSENGWLHVSKTDDTRAMAHEAALMAGELGAAVEPWPAHRVREALQSPRYFHGLHYPQGFCLHPLNYALGLAAAAEAAGARIFEDTPVLEIDPAGVRKRVITQHSRVRAAHLVLAGNVHMTEQVSQFANTLLPIFSTTIITAPLGDELSDAIRYPGAVGHGDPAGQHHRVVDGRLMWSGRSSVKLGKPQRQADALVRQVRRTYPSLRNLKAEHAWIGATGHAVHGMPQIGEVAPGLWLLNGFGSHGLNTTAMAGEMVAHAIVDGDRAWEMFSPFALVWAGGAFGRAAQRVSEWSRRARDRWDGIRARGRAGNLPRIEAPKPVVVAPPAIPRAPLPAIPDVPPPIEPVAEPPPVPATVVAPAAAVAQSPPEIPEGQSGAAAPPIPDAPAAPAVVKRPKRGPKKKKAATLRDLSQQIVERESAPADSAAPGDPPDGSRPPPLPDNKT
jgi:glycine/D-amino acid oxidase-like deaminating enzyme